MAERAVVLGASGFGGAELLRLLAGHGQLQVVGAGAATSAGIRIASAFPHLASYGEMAFAPMEEAAALEADVVFCSVPGSESRPLLAPLKKAGGPKLVDLGADFRIGEWVYGLAEWRREEIRGAAAVANPGCYPAAALLGLLPLAEAGVISGGVHIDAKSGVSGAGRAASEGVSFSSANENLRPYSVTGHGHIAEIEQELESAAGHRVPVTFVPHLVPMTRGLMVSCAARAEREVSTTEVLEILAGRYAGEPFVRVLGAGDLPETRRLAGTNLAELAARVDDRTGTVLVFAAIDNLGKGAAGQAVQNANLMLGIDEAAGLGFGGMAP